MVRLPPRVWLLSSLLAASVAFAASPSSGTLTDTSGPLHYTAGPFPLANPTPVPLVDSGPECNNPAQPCDDYLLTVSLPSDYATQHPNDRIRIALSWTDSGAGASDYDLYVYGGTVTTTDGSQQAQNQSASSANPEVATLRAFNGTRTFTVKVVPYTPTGETVQVDISLEAGATGPAPDTGFGQATPTSPGVPRYQVFVPPADSSANASSGEFSIGFNPKTGNILTLSDLNTFRVTPPEKRSPALPEAGPALWTDVSPSIDSVYTLDPILHTDRVTGRTFESMQTTGAEALFGYSDDDGASWIQASAAPPNAGADHQTIGTGPYPALFGIPNPAYPNAVYYCSQDIVGPATCQRSDTGGATFGPGVPIYEGNGITACSGLHGHVKVGPDGAVYVPVPSCGTQQGGVVSLDAGLTWTQFLIPGSQSFTGGSTDPSIGIDADNTAYECYVDGTGPEHHVHVAVSHDHGATWVNDTDIGAAVGVVNAVFPEAVAGSSGRAACGFLGSNIPGDHEALDYPGNWYLFLATTYDGGKTWTTVNATPNDPVQGAGGIWNGGGSNMNRNLLDFNEVTMDDRGRVVFGFDDGCVSDRCLSSNGAQNDFVADERVARQTGGKSLLAQYDAAEPTTPRAPYLEASRDATQVALLWNPPDNGGSDLTAYQVYRGTAAGAETLLATVSGAKTQFQDATVSSSVAQYFYEVVAVNAVGSGPRSNEVLAQAQDASANDVCKAPGPTILTDASGDSLTSTPGSDLRALEVSQPYSTDGVLRLRFELDTDPGVMPQPPGASWYVSFQAPDGKVHGVRMTFPAGTSSLTAPTFESYLASPNSSGTVDGRFVTSGSEKPADPSSAYDPSHGRIVIIVPASDVGVTAGSTVNGFNAGAVQAVDTSAGGAAEVVDGMPDSLAYAGSYTASDNASCAPNSPPLAAFTATPTEGTAPLAISFDASASKDPDVGDSVTSYTFNFGDGSAPVTQSSPTTTHTYANAGDYKAVLTVTDSHGAKSQNAAAVELQVEAFFEDTDPHLAYDKGWHTVKDSNASGGTFHLLESNSGQHGVTFTFQLGSSSGTFEYAYATATQGGTADVYLDGAKVQTVSFKGSSGSLHQPVFGAAAAFPVSGAGQHTFELRNVTGGAFLDRLSIAGSSSDAEPAENPGPTATSSKTLSVGQNGLTQVTVPEGSDTLSVIAESPSGIPYSLALIDPSGKILTTATSSASGVTSVELPVNASGLYGVQLVNLGIGPLQIWSAATPQVRK